MPLSAANTTLARCPLFHGMTGAEREEISALLEVLEYPSGKTIIAEGTTQQSLWILTRGSVRVLKNSPESPPRELSVLEPVNVFGEMSFFVPAPHSATIEAVTAVEVSRLSREKYDMLLRISSLAAYKLAYNTVGVLSARLRRMDELAATLTSRADAPQHHELNDFHSKLYAGWQF